MTPAPLMTAAGAEASALAAAATAASDAVSSERSRLRLWWLETANSALTQKLAEAEARAAAAIAAGKAGAAAAAKAGALEEENTVLRAAVAELYATRYDVISLKRIFLLHTGII